MAADITSLEAQLNDLDASRRKEALTALAQLARDGEVSFPPLSGAVNVHFHTFFSFNAEDYSPSRIVWEGKKAGLDVVGSVDFDVLDAMGEMFAAGDLLDVRVVAALESRVYMSAYADKDINSPGEAGVSYFMGTGFTKLPSEGSGAYATLQAMRQQATDRNLGMLARVNPALQAIALDYETDVIPLTPSANATERHMLAAYDNKARAVFANEDELAAFWAEALGCSAEDAMGLLKDTAKLRNTIRAKLMKRGGVGYVQPDESTFPKIETVAQMILDCEAIPCGAWLDGTTNGEADAGTLLDDYMAVGCLAFNIIPDRNWNIKDAETKALKVAKFGEIVAEAKKRDLIFSIGTEMNNYGLKFVDTFDAPEMKPFAKDFLDGAVTLYGHTLMQRACGMGRTSAWAKNCFADDRAAANAFYLAVGQKGASPVSALGALQKVSATDEPGKVLELL